MSDILGRLKKALKDKQTAQTRLTTAESEHGKAFEANKQAVRALKQARDERHNADEALKESEKLVNQLNIELVAGEEPEPAKPAEAAEQAVARAE